MLWTIVVILLVLWFLGFVGSYTMGGFILRTTRWLGRRLHSHLGRLPVIRSRSGPRDELTDDLLLARVRCRLGCVSHPEAIQTQIEAGHLTVSGPILAREVGRLLRQVGKVPGVVQVNNRLRVQRESEHVPE